jgi:hypothetical protein
MRKGEAITTAETLLPEFDQEMADERIPGF